MWLLLAVSCCLFAKVHCEANCSALPDGHYNIGCKTYEVCAAGQHSTVECGVNMVYNDKTEQCDFQNNVAPPCGLVQDCTNKADGTYPDVTQNCTSYYTCNHNTYFGHNYCTPGTVFNDTIGTCVWPEAGQPPCGK